MRLVPKSVTRFLANIADKHRRRREEIFRREFDDTDEALIDAALTDPHQNAAAAEYGARHPQVAA